MNARARVLVFLVLAGCGEDHSTISGVERGEDVFSDPSFSKSRFNDFSCATCHSAEAGTNDVGVSIGYSLYNSANRSSWWGGREARLIDAVEFCYVYFMRGAPLSKDDENGRALYEYLVHISPDPMASALPLTIVENVRDVPNRDRGRGETVYEAACAVCHGEAHTGEGRINELAAIIPEASAHFAHMVDAEPRLVVIEKIRHGQFFGVGGNMPPFSLETLSDADLSAVLAYLDL